MTSTIQMTAKQDGAGAPLSIVGVALDPTPADLGTHRLILGVKTTTGAPATFAALAHMDAAADEWNSATFWDTANERFTGNNSAGVMYGATDQSTVTKYLRLDSNYVAGRYLWFIAWRSNTTPAGSDVPSLLAAPYLIT